MKTMHIEKKLHLHDRVDEVSSLHVKEALKYNKEEDGIRAVGPLYITGQYMYEGVSKPFQEVLDMDVLAPTEKLNPDDGFHLNVSHYEAEPMDMGIQLFVELQISGLLEDSENAPVEVFDTIPTPQPVMEPVVEEIAKPVNGTEPTDVSALEDLFEGDDQVYTSYRMIVAKSDDTYTKIANRYDVDEETLKNTNRNKDIIAKTLVVLPFGQASI